MKTTDIDFDRIRQDTEFRPEHCSLCADSDQFYGRVNFKQPEDEGWPLQVCPNHPDMRPVALEATRGR